MPHRRVLAEALAKVLPADAFTLDEAVAELYGPGTFSARRLRGDTPPIRPAAVVWPESAVAVARVVALAGRLALPLYPRGAATSPHGGGIPFAPGIVLDMRRMNRLSGLDIESGTVEVEAGMSLGRLQALLNPHGLTLDPEAVAENPPSTVGGAISRRGSAIFGPLTRAGERIDRVVALEVALPDGRLIRTHGFPGFAGRDLTALFVGAEGHFGVITKAWISTDTIPAEEWVVDVPFRGRTQAIDAARTVLREGMRPSCLMVVDPAEDRYRERDPAPRSSWGAALLHFALRPGDALRKLAESGGSYRLRIGFCGDADLVAARWARAKRRLAKLHGGTPTRLRLPERLEEIHLDRFVELRLRRFGRAVERLSVGLPAARADAAVGALTRLVHSRATLGGARLRFLAPDATRFDLWWTHPPTLGSGTVGSAPTPPRGELLAEAQHLARMHGATLAVVDGVGLAKAAGVLGELGPMLPLLSTWRRALDPTGLVNPGVLGL